MDEWSINYMIRAMLHSADKVCKIYAIINFMGIISFM